VQLVTGCVTSTVQGLKLRPTYLHFSTRGRSTTRRTLQLAGQYNSVVKSTFPDHTPVITCLLIFKDTDKQGQTNCEQGERADVLVRRRFREGSWSIERAIQVDISEERRNRFANTFQNLIFHSEGKVYSEIVGMNLR